MTVNGQLNLIVGMLKDNGKALAALDTKLDLKIGDVHERINEEVSTCHKRINPLESWQEGANEKFKSLRGRMNWLYFIVGGLVVGGGGAVISWVLMNRG